MIAALDNTREKVKMADSSFIDLELSLLVEPLCSDIQTDLTEELKANEMFQELLETSLNPDINYNLDTGGEGDNSDLDLKTLIQKEAEKCKQFEEFLMRAVRDN